MAKANKRTDSHRPGAIVPSAYTYLCSYALPDFEGEGEYNTDEASSYGRTDGARVFGSVGHCGVCGAGYRYGDVWEHDNGEIVHLGHDCAEKYSLLASRPGFDAALATIKRARAARIEAEARVARLARFCAQNEGMEEALATDHYIVRDIANRVRQFGEISEKQIALVKKIAREEKARLAGPTKEEEKHVPAPEGRVTVRGRVVSKKGVESSYGWTLKMTVKVETPEGSWLAWGTVPDSLSLFQHPTDEFKQIVLERGDEIEFSATLARGRDAHFALFKRPTKAKIVTLAPRDVAC
jgi:hypothetical protein